METDSVFETLCSLDFFNVGRWTKTKNPAIVRDYLDVTFTDQWTGRRRHTGYQASRCLKSETRFTLETTKDIEELKQRVKMECYKMSRGMFMCRVFVECKSVTSLWLNFLKFIIFNSILI
jgi:hypothetical protein